MRYLPHVVLYTGLALVVHSMLGCSGVQHLDVRGAPTFTLAEVRDPAAGPRVAAAMRRSGFLLKLRRGDALPVQLSSRLGVAHLGGAGGQLILDRDVIICLSGRRILISPDGQRWAPLGHWRAMRRLFGLRGGTFQVGFGISKANGARITLALNAHP